MKKLFPALLSLALDLGAGAAPAHGIAEVTLVDRDTGAALQPHYYRGEYWVAGRPGARYGIEIQNRRGERLLAVTSVDGVNVVSGETAAWDQTGYVFEPWQDYQITGWRKTDAEVAAFTFTDLPHSYAARTGRAENVGVIGVAIFRERAPPPSIAESSAPADDSRAAAGAPSSRLLNDRSPMARASPGAPLGTGHGPREYSSVARTQFQRLRAQPDQVIEIHYDSLDNLLAMGIVARPRPQPPRPQPENIPEPFPGSIEPRYVPDPAG